MIQVPGGRISLESIEAPHSLLMLEPIERIVQLCRPRSTITGGTCDSLSTMSLGGLTIAFILRCNLGCSRFPTDVEGRHADWQREEEP